MEESDFADELLVTERLRASLDISLQARLPGCSAGVDEAIESMLIVGCSVFRFHSDAAFIPDDVTEAVLPRLITGKHKMKHFFHYSNQRLTKWFFIILNLHLQRSVYQAYLQHFSYLRTN